MRERGKTGFRRRASADSDSYVQILYSPDDVSLSIPIYNAGKAFDKKSFAGTLSDGSYPSGMVVLLTHEAKEYTLMVCNIIDYGPCLRECGVDRLLIEGGVTLMTCGSYTSPALEVRMDFNDYQVAALNTSGAYGVGETDNRKVLSALCLAGEVGELCNLIKKMVAHGHDIPSERIADELGDILWYVAEVATANGLVLEDVARQNITKLHDRYPDGFNKEASVNREESDEG